MLIVVTFLFHFCVFMNLSVTKAVIELESRVVIVKRIVLYQLEYSTDKLFVILRLLVLTVERF